MSSKVVAKVCEKRPHNTSGTQYIFPRLAGLHFVSKIAQEEGEHCETKLISIYTNTRTKGQKKIEFCVRESI